MKLSSIFCLLTAASTSLAAIETVSYDPGYDQAGRAMTAVACSDGANGLITSTRNPNPNPTHKTNLSLRVWLPDPRSHPVIPTHWWQWRDFRLERSSMRHLLQGDVQGQEYLRPRHRSGGCWDQYVVEGDEYAHGRSSRGTWKGELNLRQTTATQVASKEFVRASKRFAIWRLVAAVLHGAPLSFSKAFADVVILL